MGYEETRTAEIIDRLVRVGDAARKFAVMGGAILLGGLLAVTGRLLVGPSLGLIAGLIGAITGYMMVGFVATSLEATFEWMAQMLILENETERRTST